MAAATPAVDSNGASSLAEVSVTEKTEKFETRRKEAELTEMRESSALDTAEEARDGDVGRELCTTAEAGEGASSEPSDNRVLISQGAEARVFATRFFLRHAVCKQRFQKKYRHQTLDSKLTTRRLQGEARAILKARKLGVATPTVLAVDFEDRSITLEFIHGQSVKDFLLLPGVTNDAIAIVASLMGRSIARLHDGGLIHGDLTTSNMILRNPQLLHAPKEAAEGQDAAASEANHAKEERGVQLEKPAASVDKSTLVLIDFGLASNSTIAEDKAVDLYVLERALVSLHCMHPQIMDLVLAEYRRCSRFWSAVHNKLAQVRMRGRKRVMVG